MNKQFMFNSKFNSGVIVGLELAPAVVVTYGYSAGVNPCPTMFVR